MHELVQKYIVGWMKIIEYLTVDDNGTKKIFAKPFDICGTENIWLLFLPAVEIYQHWMNLV
jgi:hypothetical protein